jgi:uncharacterized protein (TIGR03546 family)
MLLPRKIKKLIKLLRGQVSPVLAGLAVGLGFWFGLMPGFYGIHALMLVLVLLLNVPIGLFILFMGFGKGASLAAAPLLYHTGSFVQSNLSGLTAFCQKIPIVGLTDFSHFALVGALLLGPVCGAAIGFAFGGMVLGFRKTWLKLEENTEKFNLWYNKKWVRVLDRIIVGKRGAKDARHALESKTRYIRKAGAVLAVLLILSLLAFSLLFQKQYVRNKAVAKLTEINGATVDIATLNLSPVSGTMKLAGVGVTDREEPTQNTVDIGEVSARASVYQMSLGKLVMDEVKVANVQFGQPRQTPGTVLEQPSDTGADGETTGGEAGGGSVPDANAADLERYIAKYEEFKAWLEKIKPWLPKGQQESVPAETPHRYLDFLSAKGGPEAAVRMWAKQVIMEKVALQDNQFGSSTIRLTNLNDAPEAAKLPVGFEIVSDAGAQMQMQMHFEEPETPGKVTGTFDAFDLSKMQGSLKEDNDLQFQSGKAGGTWAGYLTQDKVDITVAARLSQLKATAKNGLFGLDPQLTQEALNTLTDLAVSLRIVGPLTDPKISFDTGDLKKQIVAAGKQRVLGEIQKQIQDKAPEEVKELMDSNDFKKGLDGLIRR